jgi:hypothetical protein
VTSKQSRITTGKTLAGDGKNFQGFESDRISGCGHESRIRQHTGYVTPPPFNQLVRTGAAIDKQAKPPGEHDRKGLHLGAPRVLNTSPVSSWRDVAWPTSQPNSLLGADRRVLCRTRRSTSQLRLTTSGSCTGVQAANPRQNDSRSTYQSRRIRFDFEAHPSPKLKTGRSIAPARVAFTDHWSLTTSIKPSPHAPSTQTAAGCYRGPHRSLRACHVRFRR